MKTYETITADVLKKHEAYKIKKKHTYKSIAAVAASLCMIMIFSLAMPTINFWDKNDSDLESYNDYSDVYNKLNTVIGKYSGTKGSNFDTDGEVAAPEGDAAENGNDDLTGEKGTNSIDYSDTNLQTAGIQEADIIKTDGKFIYALSAKYLYIVSADSESGKLAIVSKIPRYQETETGYYNRGIIEFYITENRLIALRNKYEYSNTNNGNVRYDVGIAEFAPDYYSSGSICVDIYDITDRENPTLINTFGQSGQYISSRMSGDSLYLVSNEFIYTGIDKDKPETYIPELIVGDDTKLVDADDIYINSNDNQNSYSTQYVVVSGIDTAGNGEIVSSKAVFGYSGTVYASRSSLYVTGYSSSTVDNTYTDATSILRFSTENGKVELVAQGNVPGSVLNQFSLDEYNDVLRIVTTVYSYTYTESNNTSGYGDSVVSVSQNNQYNNLYTLSPKLEIIGKIENLASNERVYSVRFDGDIGYFVTFRQVDPLFSVDLSDPENPKVLGELKIPGFSNYMQPYDDGLLFGLGMNADENGRTGFLKLSMFDTSNPADVTEINVKEIKGFYYSEASYNHKAVLINKDKNIIAFPADGKYLVYSYSDENGFVSEATISLTNISNQYYGNTRGLYIGNYLYVLCDGGISSYNMSSYKFINEVEFDMEINDGSTVKPGYDYSSGSGSGYDSGNGSSTDPVPAK